MVGEGRRVEVQQEAVAEEVERCPRVSPSRPVQPICESRADQSHTDAQKDLPADLVHGHTACPVAEPTQQTPCAERVERGRVYRP